MNEMKVAMISFSFNPKEIITVESFDFPKGTEILSAKIKEDPNTIWVTSMAPSKKIDTEPLEKITFIVCSYKCSNMEFDHYTYISNINIDDTRYAVFYKK